MKAILLAAGIGSRISREVSKPKSLLDIGNGMPLIRHTAELLLSKNIEVAVVVGYRKNLFYNALRGLPVKFYYNPFYRVSNSIASLWFAQEFMDTSDDFLFMNADVYFEKEILDKTMESEEEVVMLADYRTIATGDYFFTLKNGLVHQYGKEIPMDKRDCEYVGVAKVKETVMSKFKAIMNSMVEAEDYKTWWETILYSHSDEINIHILDVAPYFWSEIDYIEDYERIVDYVHRKTPGEK